MKTITAKNITKKEAVEIYQLLEQWTRAEIMARHAPLVPKEYAEYYSSHIAIGDKLRRKLFGTDNLYDLGIKWGILKEQPTRKERRHQKSTEEKSEVHPLLLHKMNKHKIKSEINLKELLKQLEETKDSEEKRKLRRLLRRRGHSGGLKKREPNKGARNGKKKKKKRLEKR